MKTRTELAARESSTTRVAEGRAEARIPTTGYRETIVATTRLWSERTRQPLEIHSRT